MVGAKQKRAISNFDKSKINLTRADNGRGQVVDHFVSDFGQAEIVLNNNLKGDELFIFDANRTKIKPLKDRGFFHEYLGRKGDRFEGQIVGEYTLEFYKKSTRANQRISVIHGPQIAGLFILTEVLRNDGGIQIEISRTRVLCGRRI